MIEPRSSILLLQKRDSQDVHSLYGDVADMMENSGDVVLEHDEPEIPIHPALEYEIVAAEIQPSSLQHRGKPPVILCNFKLLLSFAGLVIFGSANSISLKLQAIPMYNYPNFLNLFTNLLYIPICFLYIIPAARYGWLQNNSDSNNSQTASQPPEGYRALPADDADVDSETSTITEVVQEDPPRISSESILEEQQYESHPTNDDILSSASLSIASELHVPLLIEGESSPTPAAHLPTPQTSSSTTSRPVSYRDFAVMGLMDSLATTMQILSAAYLPGPLLILLPQAAIPLTLLFASCYKPEYKWTQYVGAATVVLGIVVLMEPLLTNRRSPSFYCEAIDDELDCTVCQMESSREGCLAHLDIPDNEHGIVQLWLRRIKDSGSESITDDQSTPEGSLCQWLPFEEATRTDEILTFVWSMVLIASCIPMTLSTFYKEWAMKQQMTSSATFGVQDNAEANVNEEDQPTSGDAPESERQRHGQRVPFLSESDPIYLNGWIAIFQLFFTVPLCIMGGLVSSPEVQSTHVLENLYSGFLCYFRGIGSITTGCHPDEMCGSASFWLVNFHLLTTVGYSFCMMYCLKHGTTTIFFLALTVMVPCELLFFVEVSVFRDSNQRCSLREEADSL